LRNIQKVYFKKDNSASEFSRKGRTLSCTQLRRVADTGTLCTASEVQAAGKGHSKEGREVLKAAWWATVRRSSFNIELPLWRFPVLTNW